MLEFVGWIFIARRLGASEFGQVSIAFLVARYLGLVADWGASLGGTRDIASGAPHGHAISLVRHRERMSLALTVGFVLGCAALGAPELAPMGACILARGLSRDWISLGEHRPTRSSLPSLVQGALLLLASVTAPASPGAISVGVGLAYAFGLIASIGLNRLRRAEAVPSPVKGWMLSISLAEQVFLTADTLLLGLLIGDQAAGVYAVAYRVPNAWMNLTGLAILGLIPGVAARVRRSSQVRELRRAAIRAGARLSLIVLLTIPVAWVLLPLVFGDEYSAARVPMSILLVASAVMTMSVGLAPLVLAQKRDRPLALWTIAVAALNVGSNLVMIPAFGMNGAAIATLASQVLLSGYWWIASRPGADTSAPGPSDPGRGAARAVSGPEDPLTELSDGGA